MNIGDQRKRLLLIDADSTSNRELAGRLAASPVLTVCQEVTQADEILSVIKSAKPDMVIVGGEGLPGAEAAVICQQVRLYFPEIVCIAACMPRELMAEPFLRSLGVWVIAKPIEANQLEFLAGSLIHRPSHGAFSNQLIQIQPIQAIQPIQPLSAVPRQNDFGSYPPAQPKKKKMITVYGPKGGVGKTFLSRELAIYFSQQQIEGRPYKVLAVDFNLDLGTFATTLNLPRTPNLYTWVQQINEQIQRFAAYDGRPIESLSHEEWQEYSLRINLSPQEVGKYAVVHEESGLHILTSPRDIRNSFEIKDYHLYVILETLKQSDYDVILLDTAPDTTDATIQALFFAEKVIMVGNPVVDAIENIHRMLKLLREANYPEERIQICINRLQRKEMYTLEEIRAYFQLHPSKTLFTIPDDEEVKRSINAGKSIVLSVGRSPAKDALLSLGKTLLFEGKEKDQHAQPAKTRERSLISRWFGSLKRGGTR